ncbi:CPBP family intramembrane glutamic endopeptidase [Cellvibrio sp. PSBB023]|uniref:CPBP family intramembrane glutamic endopeptidase n=1 Tax=Cellvibrio sp. PSBB023 TaxID=1945512 RepID=UPI00098F316B|nr:CPBP family intramembrane glutamic endopeptidase [Cellvibrio sp. PSBB023]AQT61026.1 CAAX protease family protein [Cellvibrio sp. PSBB023]
MALAALHPRRIMQALDAIDAEAPSYSLSRPAALRRVFAVLAAVCVSLLILHYSRYSTNFHALLGYLGQWRMQDAHYYLRALEASGWLELAGYAWWTGCHLFTFILIPWLVIRWLFKEKMIDFGWRWNQVGAHWRGYLLLLSPILVFVVLVSFGEDFVNHYPFYGLAGRSWLDFLLWELLYMSQFIFLEFFFRGFMLNALRPALGANAIWVMCVPYLMIHFPKLWLEATGAILFGLFLGILALRSRSIWGGVLVHAGVALSMDIAALLRKQEMPGLFFSL